MKPPRVDRFDATHKHCIQPEAVNLTGVPPMEQKPLNESPLSQTDPDLVLPLHRPQEHTPALPLTASPPSSAASQQAKAQLDTSHVPHDVVTSLLHDVNLRNWRDAIENTETQNSALRLTSAERYAVEDVISELRRKEKIKTSMNEIARLGLLLLIHDFHRNRKNSVVYQVKKS
jgi:hypothetical protein